MQSNRMKMTESKKSHSWWWDSHINPKNSRWLQENLEEMDEHVKRMLKLVEEDDADSFAKKAELYFKKRPDLIALIEDFYRMYRSLAERYDHLTGELRRNIPSDLRSQGSAASDITSEPYLRPRPARTNSGPRSDDSPTPDYESDDNSSSVNYPGPQVDSTSYPRGPSEISFEPRAYESEPRFSRENIVKSDEESWAVANETDSRFIRGSGRNGTLESGENEKLRELQEDVASLRNELRTTGSVVLSLQEQLRSSEAELPVWKNRFEREKREVAKLQDRITRYKNNLSERERDIRSLQEAISDANTILSAENERLKSDVAKIEKERAYLVDHVKELDLRVRRAEAEKASFEGQIAERDELLEELKTKHVALAAVKDELDARVVKMSGQLDELRVWNGRLAADADVARRFVEEWRLRAEELEREVERRDEALVEGAEEKREAIRQLCLSIEHYRTGYHELWEAVVARERAPLMAAQSLRG